MRALGLAVLLFVGCTSKADEHDLAVLESELELVKSDAWGGLQSCYDGIHNRATRMKRLDRWRALSSQKAKDEVTRFVELCDRDVPMRFLRQQRGADVPACIDRIKAVATFSAAARGQERGAVADVLRDCCRPEVAGSQYVEAIRETYKDTCAPK